MIPVECSVWDPNFSYFYCEHQGACLLKVPFSWCCGWAAEHCLDWSQPKKGHQAGTGGQCRTSWTGIQEVAAVEFGLGKVLAKGWG